MRIVNVLVFAVCFFDLASAKGKMKKQKDDQIYEGSSIDPRSSNWVPIVLRRTGYGSNINYDDDYQGRDQFVEGPPMRQFPPFYRAQNQLFDPVGKAYVRVEMEHPIYTGRTLPSSGDTSRPNSGVISVIDNSDIYTAGSYGNQGQGSVTPLALSSDYGSSGTAAAQPVTSNGNNGYNGNSNTYSSYGSSAAYTNHASNGQSGVSSDYTNGPSASDNGYSNALSGPDTSYNSAPLGPDTGYNGAVFGPNNGYNAPSGPSSSYSNVPSSSYESNYNNDGLSQYYQTGPVSTGAYDSGAYGPSSGAYTISPAPSSGYVGYGGTFHNYGQHTTYPVAYRGRQPHIFVVGAFGSPWSTNQIEQEAGYYLYR